MLLHCVACGTIKKERSYALCSECCKVNGTLDRALFIGFARHTERESAAYSYRTHPDFAKACRIYDRRRQKARMLDAPRAREEADPDTELRTGSPRLKGQNDRGG